MYRGTCSPPSISSAIQVQARVGGKRIRRNKQIVEILDIDPRTNELITNEVFKWRSATDEHHLFREILPP